MRTIHFKNGQTLGIDQEMFDIISKSLVEHGNRFFISLSVEGETDLLINVKEINFID